MVKSFLMMGLVASCAFSLRINHDLAFETANEDSDRGQFMGLATPQSVLDKEAAKQSEDKGPIMALATPQPLPARQTPDQLLALSHKMAGPYMQDDRGPPLSMKTPKWVMDKYVQEQKGEKNRQTRAGQKVPRKRNIGRSKYASQKPSASSNEEQNAHICQQPTGPSKIPLIGGKPWVYSNPFKITCSFSGKIKEISRFSFCHNAHDCEVCMHDYSKCQGKVQIYDKL